MASAPAPQFESGDFVPPVICAEAATAQPVEALGPTDPAVLQEPDELSTPTPVEYIGVVHLTRTWIQYGIFGFAVLCIVIGAVEAMFGR